MNIGTKWVLKGHAQTAFFAVHGACPLRKPSDLGFSDGRRSLHNSACSIIR